jgi:hypothetical protein
MERICGLNANQAKELHILDYTNLPSDVLYNIMLNANYNTLINLSEINKDALKYYNDLSFWLSKIQHQGLNFYGNVKTIDDYKNYAVLMSEAEIIADIIIKIANIEKEYDRRHPPNPMMQDVNNGSIMIRWEGPMIDHINADDIVPVKLKNEISNDLNNAKQLSGLEYTPNIIKLTPIDNHYEVNYEMLDEEGDDTIDVTINMSFEEIRKLLIDAQYIALLTKNIYITDWQEDPYYANDQEKYMKKVDNFVIKYYTRLGIRKTL